MIRSWPWLLALVLLVAGGTLLLPGEPAEPATAGGDITFRRLSEDQYKRSIEAAFGDWVKVPGRFDPPRREEGLLSIGNSRVDVSRAGFEQAELRAREIAAQVFADARRDQFVRCAPEDGTPFNESCARQFVEEYGTLLYRRPLDEAEMASVLDVAREGAYGSSDFYRGMELALSRLLLSPNVIYRSESVAIPIDESGTASLEPYSLAARISFLLWDAAPDAELLGLAATGELNDPLVLERQVERMIGSPRFEHGVRAFFSDMFGYEEFDRLSKEQLIYPAFSTRLKEDAREQVLRTIVDLLVTREADYRELFTTRETVINRRLGAVYQVAVPEQAMEDWAPYEFPADVPRQGIFSLAAFLMLDPTHEGRTSPTIRGQAVRERYLCQKVPPPPPAVDFALLQETENAQYRTARDRLRVHAETPTCAGCHAITDPIGLALENFDGIGIYRTTENGAPIDASGTFEGNAFGDALEFQQLLADSSAVTGCLVKRVYEYGVGRPVNAGEMQWMGYLNEQFAEAGYALAPLMKRIATSRAFRAIAPTPGAGQSLSVAAAAR